MCQVCLHQGCLCASRTKTKKNMRKMRLSVFAGICMPCLDRSKFRSFPSIVRACVLCVCALNDGGQQNMRYLEYDCFKVNHIEWRSELAAYEHTRLVFLSLWFVALRRHSGKVIGKNAAHKSIVCPATSRHSGSYALDMERCTLQVMFAGRPLFFLRPIRR